MDLIEHKKNIEINYNYTDQKVKNKKVNIKLD